VQRILQLHGGGIQLADGLDKGAVFRFTLPLA